MHPPLSQFFPSFSSGRLVRDPSTEEVWLNDWPTPGKRKLAPGTGKQNMWKRRTLQSGMVNFRGGRDGETLLPV